MRRFAELRLILLLGAALAAAAVLGKAVAPRTVSKDPRLSTRLNGPAGAMAFRTALTRFGVDVSERRTPFFDLGRSAPPDSTVLLAVLAPAATPTMPERQAVRDWVARGGRLLIAGETGLEGCFGYARVVIDSSYRSPWIDVTNDVAVYQADQVPRSRAVLRRHAPDDVSENGDLPGQTQHCEPIAATSVDKLWVAGRDPAAIRLHFAGGGEVILVADETVFSNRALRASDAGPMIFGWILAGHPRAVLVDEYHQGFGRASSLPGAVWERTWRTPLGWALIQLSIACLLYLFLNAIRFGPALAAIDRMRRSPLEHLDALAAGLERSHGSRTAMALLVSGLRRRLGGAQGRARGDHAAWLDTLAAGARSPASRDAIQNLRRVTRADAAGADVMRAANAVEDVWETILGQARRGV